MTFSTTSFLTGVGTMFAAVALGFAGGAMITTAPKVEQNRLERVAASVQAATPAAAAKADAATIPTVATAKSEGVEGAPAPDRVIAMTPARATQASASSPPQPEITLIDSAKKARESELRQEAEQKKAERRAERRERRKHREIEAASNAVRQMQRDGVIQEVSQRDYSSSLGFFGSN